jgi:hypothetical protein
MASAWTWVRHSVLEGHVSLSFGWHHLVGFCIFIGLGRRHSRTWAGVFHFGLLL